MEQDCTLNGGLSIQLSLLLSIDVNDGFFFDDAALVLLLKILRTFLVIGLPVLVPFPILALLVVLMLVPLVVHLLVPMLVPLLVHLLVPMLVPLLVHLLVPILVPLLVHLLIPMLVPLLVHLLVLIRVPLLVHLLTFPKLILLPPPLSLYESVDNEGHLLALLLSLNSSPFGILFGLTNHTLSPRSKILLFLHAKHFPQGFLGSNLSFLYKHTIFCSSGLHEFCPLPSNDCAGDLGLFCSCEVKQLLLNFLRKLQNYRH